MVRAQQFFALQWVLIKERVGRPVVHIVPRVADPRAVHLGATDRRPGVKGIVKAVPAIDQVRRVVDELRAVAARAQDLGDVGHVAVERLPGVKGRAIASPDHVVAVGDGGKAGCKGAVIVPRARCQAVQVGRVYMGAPPWRPRWPRCDRSAACQ